MELKIYKSMKDDFLRDAWKKMEASGSPFCYYDYMSYIERYVKHYSFYSVRIVCVTTPSEGIIMIVPLKWDCYKHIYKMLGDIKGCGQTDALFAPLLPIERQRECVSFFYTTLGHQFYLRRLSSDSLLRTIPEGIPYKEKLEMECVSIHLPFEPGQTLSKSVRQNIRTAYNRTKRDNICYEFKIFQRGTISQEGKLWRKMTDIYVERLLSKYKKKARNNPLYRKIFAWRYKYLKHDTKSLRSLPNSFHAVLMCGDNIMAFLSGFMSHDENTLVIPRLSINATFRTYSPGYILLTELQHYLESETPCKTMDLSRGTEQYKLDLGGIRYNTYAVKTDNVDNPT